MIDHGSLCPREELRDVNGLDELVVWEKAQII
jgi:hypothetical protein